MLTKSDNKDFIASLRNGDIGIICANNFFAKLQALYAHRFKEGSCAASHGFYVKIPPEISEANGIIISGSSTILKDVGDATKCWVFRYTKLTDTQLARMNVFTQASEQTSGHYSVWGICQFAKSFVTGKREQKDEGGVFCTEYTSDIIKSALIADYIADLPSWQIDPTYQLNWFLDKGGPLGWILAGYYDGKEYWIDDSEVKLT